MTITRRQQDVLTFVTDYTHRSGGQAPTLAQIAIAIGLSSVSTVHRHLTHLQNKGFIERRWNRARSTRVATATELQCPYCGKELSLSSMQLRAKVVESAGQLDGPHQRANADTTLTPPGAMEAPRHG